MVLSLISIAIVGGIGYVWLSRGFLSAFVHLACTLVAGAIAFAVWEPTAYALIGAAGTRSGFATKLLADSAWGIALAIPFALSLVLLRLGADSIVNKNAKVSDVVNAVGGLGCGLASGAITAGVLVVSASYLRLPATMFGYQAAQLDGPNGIVKGSGLWVPVDAMVTGLYGGLSETSLSTGQPFAKHYPYFTVTASAQRMSYESESKNNPHRNTVSPEHVSITGTYRVASQGSQAKTIADGFRGGDFGFTPHFRVNGETRDPNTELFGVKIEFKAQAQESFGQTVIGPGQLWLTVENPETNERDVVFPYAVVSKERNQGQARFLFDAPNTFVPSQGGENLVPMTFEFPLEPGYQPVSLTVRNTRLLIDDAEPEVFETLAARDATIESGGVLNRDAEALAQLVESLDDAEAKTVGSSTGSAFTNYPENVSVTTRMPASVTFQKGRTRGVKVGAENRITGGEGKFTNEEAKSRGVTKELRVDSFAVTDGSNLVMIDVAGDPSQNKQSLLGRSVQTAQRVVPIQLVGTNGERFDAVGYVYKDGEIVELRYTPTNPLRGLTETPALSSTRDNQELHMIFRATVGAKIQSLVIGNKVIVEYETPFEIPRAR